MKEEILIVDDDPSVRKAMSAFLASEGYDPVPVQGGKEALLAIRKKKPDVVLLDLRMPGMDGIETLQEIRKEAPDLTVMMVSAHGDIHDVVRAIKFGATDFLLKPVDYEHLGKVLAYAVEKGRLQSRVRQLDQQLDSSLERMLGQSEVMKRVISDIRKVAVSDFSIIIEGETGTGKTHIANIIHSLGRRNKGPFVTVDIGTIPETLIESELFGYEKGAFTGAEKRKKGYFEMAHGGTLFIDELQNLSPYIQSKFLKIVEERKFHPVGSTVPVETDIRVIGATNADIKESVKEKRFREDLYYRLNEFTIKLPPLRERTEDIPFLSGMFLSDVCAELDKPRPGIHDGVMEFFMQYSWNGNIRELKNVVRKAALLSEDQGITMDLISVLFTGSSSREKEDLLSVPTGNTLMSLREAEEEAIRRALAHTGGNKTKAANILGVTTKTLLSKIREYDL